MSAGDADPDSGGDAEPGDGEPAPDLFSVLGRASILLDAVQTSCLAEFDLNYIDYSTLQVLTLAGDPYRLPPSRMAEILLRTTGGMTRIVDRLEARGLVERGRHGPDRRVVLVGLTPAGLELGDAARQAYHARRAKVLEGWSEAELADVTSSLESLVASMERDRRRRPR